MEDTEEYEDQVCECHNPYRSCVCFNSPLCSYCDWIKYHNCEDEIKESDYRDWIDTEGSELEDGEHLNDHLLDY